MLLTELPVNEAKCHLLLRKDSKERTKSYPFTNRVTAKNPESGWLAEKLLLKVGARGYLAYRNPYTDEYLFLISDLSHNLEVRASRTSVIFQWTRYNEEEGYEYYGNAMTLSSSTKYVNYRASASTSPLSSVVIYTDGCGPRLADPQIIDLWKQSCVSPTPFNTPDLSKAWEC
jgi:hypothetical protein